MFWKSKILNKFGKNWKKSEKLCRKFHADLWFANTVWNNILAFFRKYSNKWIYGDFFNEEGKIQVTRAVSLKSLIHLCLGSSNIVEPLLRCFWYFLILHLHQLNQKLMQQYLKLLLPIQKLAPNGANWFYYLLNVMVVEVTTP